MIDWIMGFFALIVLSAWSTSDVRSGKVHNLALFVPLPFAFWISPGAFIAAFVPVFVVLFGLWAVVRKKGLFGFADVIALPFTMMFLTVINVFGIMAFVAVFAYLVMVTCRERFDQVLKQKVYNRILLLPVLLISFFIGFVVHLIAAWIF